MGTAGKDTRDAGDSRRQRWRGMEPEPPDTEQHCGEDGEPDQAVQEQEKIARGRIAWRSASRPA
jgi:hypothetical protein